MAVWSKIALLILSISLAPNGWSYEIETSHFCFLSLCPGKI